MDHRIKGLFYRLWLLGGNLRISFMIGQKVCYPVPIRFLGLELEKASKKLREK
jgi:hypothetical protein